MYEGKKSLKDFEKLPKYRKDAIIRYVRGVALTMAASTQVLDEYPDLLDYFDEARVDMIKEMFPKEYAESELELENEMDYTTEGNVIKLTKWTKTMGEA